MLQEKWANLLANAADPRQKNPTNVSFVSILRELTSREVKFLDALYERIDGTDGKKPLAIYSDKRGYVEQQLLSVYGEAGLLRCPELADLPSRRDMHEYASDIKADMDDFHQMMGILERNEIVSVESYPKPLRVQIDKPKAVLGYLPAKIDIETEKACNLTRLGLSFINACRAPGADL
jgi:hypothetical protein